MGKRLAFKYDHHYTPSHDDRVKEAVRKLRENGDYALADKVGQMPLIVVKEQEPVQLELFDGSGHLPRGAGDEPQ